MNLIKELEPFEAELKKYSLNGALPQGQVKDKLADIYEAYQKDHKYIGPDKVKRSCPSCVGDMMKSLVNNLREEKSKATVEFKAVPQKKAKVTEVKKPDYSSMKMHEIRTIAKEKGLKIYNTTTRDEIIKMLS